MREKNAKSIYGLKFPVKIAVKKEEEPLHWHKDLEILCVLKGKINLQVNNAFYELKEDDIFLINSEDLHSISMVQEKSTYLSLNIVLMYYEKFFMELEYIVFIDDDSINSPENFELQQDVKWRLAQMLVEIKNKNVDYQNRIIYNASSLLAVLINNYNMVKKNVKSYKNKEQFSRIWKAYEYMYTNANRRIGLAEVAEYVNVSNSYLSHIIKGTMGVSFEKLLNQIRAEQSLKFLLSTDKSITKISEECGFSDPKYYKNFFMQFFHCTPGEYRIRNQHKVAEGDFETKSYFETIVFNELLNIKIAQYLDDPVKEAEESLIDLTIDFTNRKEQEVLQRDWKKELMIRPRDLKDAARNTGKIRMIQQEIGFEYMNLLDILHSHFFEYDPEHPPKIDWNEMDRFIEMIVEFQAYPKIGFRRHDMDSETFLTIVQKFLFHYKLKYGDAQIKYWKPVFYGSAQALEKDKIKLDDIIKSITGQLDAAYLTEDAESCAMEDSDADESGITLIQEILKGCRRIDNYFERLVDHRGLKSNLYFAYLFLNKLERQVIGSGEHYLVTKGHNKIVILAFNHKESNQSKLEIAINILNLKGKRYVLKQYSLYGQQEKAETYIKNVTDTDYMSDDDIKSINRGRYPDLCIEFFEHFESIHRSLTILPNRAELFMIERVL